MRQCSVINLIYTDQVFSFLDKKSALKILSFSILVSIVETLSQF